MFLLYSALMLLLLCSIGLLTIPFIATSSRLGKSFFVLILFFSVLSLALYLKTSQQPALKHWLTEGKQHYQLQETIEQLGGFTGMIQRIQQKLATHPDDAEGWFILGKLYLANGDYIAAKEALGKAKALQPNNSQINHYYEQAVEKQK